MLAAFALAALAGFPGAQPPAPAYVEAQAALCALLTEPLAPRLAAPDPRPLLVHLAGSVRTAEVGRGLGHGSGRGAVKGSRPA